MILTNAHGGRLKLRLVPGDAVVSLFVARSGFNPHLELTFR